MKIGRACFKRELLTLIGGVFFLMGVTHAQAVSLESTRTAAPLPIIKFIPPRVVEPVPAKGEHSIWAEVSSQFNQTLPNLSGAAFRVGYQPGAFGFDLQFMFANTTYGRISVAPDPSVASSLMPDPSAEISRTRQPSDRWSILLFEPGFNVAGHLFTSFPSILTERARFGFGYGNFTDITNAIPFTGYLLSFEAGVQCRLGSESHFAVELSANFREGILASQKLLGPDGELPVLFLSSSISLLIWL